jgi:uncharacterized protein (TIGR00730 family)
MKKPVIARKAYDNRDFLRSSEARPIRILSEYLEPLTRLRSHKVNSTILFFGSSRATPGPKPGPLTRYYWDAEELAFLLARWAIKLRPKGKNYVICTGAGPGIMEAANRGAHRAGGKSIGMNISLPDFQNPNPYISAELAFQFHYFFMRKFWLISPAAAIIVFPGGFGTFDELFETLTLVQTRKINPRRLLILLYGEEYWRRVVNFEALLQSNTLTPQDLEIFSFASTPRQAFTYLRSRLLTLLPRRR